MKRLWFLLLPLLLLAPAAQAAEQYWTAEAGFFLPAANGLDPGLTVEGAYGTRLVDLAPALNNKGPFWKKLWVEAGGGYYHAEYEVSVLGSKYSGDMDVVPLTVTALLRQPVNRVFDLYAGLGAGLYLVKVDYSYGPGTAGLDELYTDVGALGLGGMAFHVGEKVEITAELKWRVVGDDADGAAVTGGVRYAF